ncbi:DUF952 domain-containing protein [Dactylosporangium sp. NPDC051484]|uniref:DUF952 domain-containing protein n=1 Tax=Dactylosporangium sp. NPDC051484 TaxID=3154942 RepID=UPI00344F1BF9
MPIYKILLPAEWSAFEAAGVSGVFEGSPLDRADGFVHLSGGDQVAGTVERYFADQPELVILAVDPQPLGEALRWERSPSGGVYPHLYAPLPRSAVAAVHRITDRSDLSALS